MFSDRISPITYIENKERKAVHEAPLCHFLNDNNLTIIQVFKIGEAVVSMSAYGYKRTYRVDAIYVRFTPKSGHSVVHQFEICRG